MRIAISGSSGMIGRHLVAALTARGDEVIHLVRRPARKPDEIFYDIEQRALDLSTVLPLDGVINLAGESIADGRWTESRKRRILESRIKTTSLISETLAGLSSMPRVLISVSAVGFYGDRGEQELTERDVAGEGFLPIVCLSWEGAAEPARKAGIRVVHPRIGIVLSSEGGALPEMARPAKFGIGGKLGSGRQFMSWIMLEDVVGAILFALDSPSLSGPVNLTVPDPVRNEEFTQVLANTLRRPSFLTVPPIALKLLMGEMAEELLLASIRVLPRKLLQAGYQFQFTDLATALQSIYRK